MFSLCIYGKSFGAVEELVKQIILRMIYEDFCTQISRSLFSFPDH
ncbi:hypothetical protein [Ruminococcus albus]|nr:hypothetical protein [Ruminococcus albus]